MQKALDYASARFDTFVEELNAYLRIPSISADSTHKGDVRRAAEWLASELRRIGMSEVELIETGGHPAVYAAHVSDPSLPTVLCYGHYDVQPPDPLDEWRTPPFEPTVIDGILYCRGSSDDKGQSYMHVKAAESYLKTDGKLPVNLKFIVEGEEEVGSKNLARTIAANKEKLAADVVLISDTAIFGPDTPSITYGLRGLAYVQVELTGPDHDLHSGVYGGAVENPVNALARLISNLHDENHRVTVPGFYDRVRSLTDKEREANAALPFDMEGFKKSVGVAETKTEAGFTPLEGTTARPTVDVNGIWGGYQGEGAKTVLPSRASAKISARLVPDQTSEEVTEKLRAYFEANTPPTMKLKFQDLHGGEAVLVELDSPYMQAAGEAVAKVFGKPAVFAREGGSIPVVADFKRILDVDTILMGFGLNTDALHSPNEHFGLDRFRKGIHAVIYFFGLLGKQAA